MLGYIPSPEHGTIDVGPLRLHAYGLMLAIGVLAAAKIADLRWRQAGNDSRVIGEIAVPVVVAGVIGARVYHLFTGYKWSDDGIVGAFEIWKGGLSIWGAVGGGSDAVVLFARRRHLDTLALLDAIGPARGRRAGDRPVGQLVQPGALRTAEQVAVGASRSISGSPGRLRAYKTFQPTFLYESIWCLIVFATIVGSNVIAGW